VLDNFQDVPESSVFHDVIAGALSEIPQFFNVVVISRTTPSPKLARLRANRTIGTLGWDQLKLRLEESLSMARAAGNHDEAAATALHRVSDGWAAGLVLLLEGSESGSGEFLPPDTTSREKVFDYFAGEILDRASAQHSELLMYTAFLPRMTVPMAVAVTGRESAGELLHHCYKRHLFTNRRGGEDETYEYHALFREFLCRRARKTLDSCELHRILIRSAALLEASGHPDAAFALYCEATDWATACALLRREALRKNRACRRGNGPPRVASHRRRSRFGFSRANAFLASKMSLRP